MTLLSRPSLRLSLRPSLVLALSALVVACSSGPGTSSSGKINAVAGENFYGDLVSRVGGDLVSVTSILSDPNVDPHTYESSPQNAQQVADATSSWRTGSATTRSLTTSLALRRDPTAR